MKSKAFILILMSLAVASCSTASNEKTRPISNDTIKSVKTHLKVESLEYIHMFRNENGEILGRLYGNQIDNSVFTDLIIVKEDEGIKIPIYVIEKTKFVNVDGVEKFPVKEIGFYGYRVSVRRDQYITLELFWNDSKDSSGADPVTIEWNSSKKLFEIMRAP